jgi:1-acyl-sn-glycerol-3-phosphate acyltransferase
MDRRWASLGRDTGVTLLLWLYFTLGFVIFFLPFYLWARWFDPAREFAFQRLNNRFYRGFFTLLGSLVPGLQIKVADAVRDLQGTVVVGNHLSYLDPLLFIATYPRQKTIVKSGFFRTPIFGWFIAQAGYMPAAASGPAGERLIRSMETLPAFFAAGGILFVFPEGTRNTGGGPVDLHEGAFKIAARCNVPLAVVRIRNTEKIFPPGRFLFQTREAVTIGLDLVRVFNDDPNGEILKAGALRKKAMAILAHPAD